MIKLPRARRHQTGQVIERSDSFYVRYYTTSENAKGRPERRRLAELLCQKDDKHHSATCLAVRRLRDDFMAKVNAAAGSSRMNKQDVEVVGFWKDTYLPWAKENLRASTVFGYEKIWKQLLESHFDGRTLQDYGTPDGSQLLTELAKRLGRHSIQHVRSLASGIFTHALNLGIIGNNPWHDVKVLRKIKAPKEAPHYTLAEAEAIIAGLKGNLGAQCIFGLAFYAGLRPSEIAGLKWEDVGEKDIKIRRGVVRRAVDETKTPESAATLPLIQPIRGMLKHWHESSRAPKEGWVFANQRGGPLNIDSYSHTIKPSLEALGIEWKGLYAGRRGAGTILVDLTGNLVAAQELLRHKSMTTTALHYKKRTENALPTGMKMLEEKANK